MTKEAHELRLPVERAVLVGAPRLDEPQERVDEHLAELERLADTAGAEVAAVVVQRLRSPNPALYIGRGKADQLREVAERESAGLVIFDEDLTPAQGVALEKRLGRRVVDRTELILDIFALRARTAEARMQVELAQLHYLRPRLKRMWTHLSRIQGGIGMRGPGETQLETDRRIIDRRIARLRRELRDVAKARATRRKSRREHFRVALVGYTNAGKSSLLKALSGAELFIEDRLFATLDSATRHVDLGDGYEALVTDTVGFIRKLPHDLVASFRATLEEIVDADLILHVVDASAPGRDEQRAAVESVLRELGVADSPTLIAFHKVDRLTHAEEEELRTLFADTLPPAVFSSVAERGGLGELREALLARVRALRPTVTVFVPSSDGRTLAEAYRLAEVLDRRETGAGIVLTARAPEALIGRWARNPGVQVIRRDAA